MTNPPKNNTSDKALVERLHRSGVIDKYVAEHVRIVEAVAAALSQPQHGGLVEAVARFLQMWDLDASGHALKGAVNNLRAALASNSPVAGEDAPEISHQERVECEERILALEMDIERMKNGERPIYAGRTAAEIAMGTYHPGDEA